MKDFFEKQVATAGTKGGSIRAPSAQQSTQVPSHASGPVFTPDHVVSVLLGQQSIVLNGFGEVDDQLSAQLPNVPIYLLSDAAAQEALVNEVNKSWRTKILLLSALILMLVLAGGLGMGWMLKASEGPATQALVWRASKVQSDGVLIWVAGREVLFPLGGMLPTGEELRHVDPIRQTYTTDAQVVTLNPKMGTSR